MRKDIAKVVFERPKGNRTWAKKTPRAPGVLLDHSGEQLNEGSNHIRRKRQKRRNMSLSPLEHFLACRVGRTWDQVWSEVCAAADVRSTLGGEIRDHVDCLVETKCWMEGRAVMADADFGPSRKVRGFYVHPRSGLLMRPREDR